MHTICRSAVKFLFGYFMIAPKENERLSVIFVGDESVGKSQLISYLYEKKFSESYKPTIGSDFRNKMYSNSMRLQIWDCSGQKRFSDMIDKYFKEKHHYYLVFDVTNRNSFSSLKTHIEKIKEYQNDTSKITLVANKIDLESKRVVSKDEALKFVSDNNLANYIEVSAKNGVDFDQFFLITLPGLPYSNRFLRELKNTSIDSRDEAIKNIVSILETMWENKKSHDNSYEGYQNYGSNLAKLERKLDAIFAKVFNAMCRILIVLLAPINLFFPIVDNIYNENEAKRGNKHWFFTSDAHKARAAFNLLKKDIEANNRENYNNNDNNNNSDDYTDGSLPVNNNNNNNM